MKTLSPFCAALAAVVGALCDDSQAVPGLQVVSGPVNGALIETNGRILAIYGLPSGTARSVDKVLLTHARRDVVWAARTLCDAGTEAVVPVGEIALFTQPELFWEEMRARRFHDYTQQSTKIPIRRFTNARGVKDGDTILWQGHAIRVIDTPGYTRGAVTYIASLGGKKVAFTGDLVRDDGKLQDLFSFQDAIPAAKIGGYHGWAGRLGDLVDSLRKVAAEKPDLIVPARGPVIQNPLATIDRLLGRVQVAYSNYLSVDALRWYFKDEHILTKAARVLGAGAQIGWMPMAETKPLPPWVSSISNSRLVKSADASGFLIDCGSSGIIDRLRQMKNRGQITSIDHVFVTHYHDDHTDALPAFVGEFGAKVHACGSLIDVLERPADYRLPCLTRNPITVTAGHRDRDSWRWKEFRLTIFDFPGQTLHHNGLLVERKSGEAVFFAGDSFTPSGIDDYCLQNRNFLGEGRGHMYCLDLLEGLPSGCLIVNQHVDPAFRFTPAELRRMRETLRQRIPLLAELLPFDDPNFGLDEGWCGFHPYSVETRGGAASNIEVRVTNHSQHQQTFRINVCAPAGWVAGDRMSVTLPPRGSGALSFVLRVPASARSGLHMITADVAWENQELREWAEAMIEVK